MKEPLTKEELSMFLESPVWQAVIVTLENYQEEARDDLITIDFSKPESNFNAIKCQAKIEVVDEVFGTIDNLKSDAVDEKE